MNETQERIVRTFERFETLTLSSGKMVYIDIERVIGIVEVSDKCSNILLVNNQTLTIYKSFSFMLQTIYCSKTKIIVLHDC